MARAECKVCGQKPKILSSELGVCLNCIRNRYSEALPHIESAHAMVRQYFNMPVKPPRTPDGLPCNICVHECRLGDGEKGFCGIRKNEGGKFVDYGGAALDWYYEPLPTNCVADFVCPAGTGSGYPEYAYTKGPEHGYKNLAVFYGACTFDCLFCQNWHFRDYLHQPNVVSAEELASQVDSKTACICYFGGDPTPQIEHSIKVSELALEWNKDRILRICWETNGSMNPKILERMAELSLKSGGSIKVDLKAWDEGLHRALTGITNQRTLENFEMLASFNKKRKDPPFLIASTLLIPGYIDVQEVSNIAKFIAKLDSDIPYTLLAFYQQFFMYDLPTTLRQQAEECQAAAEEAGLKTVRLGNVHLLR